MSLEELYQLNLRFPIRISMVLFHVEDCLNQARICLQRNDYDTTNVMIKLAGDGIHDLEYTLKRGKMN